EGARHDARALAEIAAVAESDILRAALLLPQRLALGFPQLGGVAVSEQRTVLRDAVRGARCVVRLPVCERHRDEDRQRQRRSLHATTASSLRLSPRLSTQFTVILSPAFAPFTTNSVKGFFAIAVPHSPLSTTLPFSAAVISVMCQAGIVLPAAS